MEKYMTEQHVKIVTFYFKNQHSIVPVFHFTAVAKADFLRVNNFAKFRISLAITFA